LESGVLFAVLTDVTVMVTHSHHWGGGCQEVHSCCMWVRKRWEEKM